MDSKEVRVADRTSTVDMLIAWMFDLETKLAMADPRIAEVCGIYAAGLDLYQRLRRVVDGIRRVRRQNELLQRLGELDGERRALLDYLGLRVEAAAVGPEEVDGACCGVPGCACAGSQPAEADEVPPASPCSGPGCWCGVRSSSEDGAVPPVAAPAPEPR